MSREDLRAMFTELADEIPPPRLVDPVVARAGRVRRRRRAAVGSALVLVVVAVSGIAFWAPQDGPVATTPHQTDDTVVDGAVRVARMPTTLVRDPEAAPYWPDVMRPPVNPPTLADSPISHAVLLYSPPPGDSETATQPVYAYGEGSRNGRSGNGTFSWVRLGVDLVNTRDADGNAAQPLDQNSLAPMGERAAFAQPDGVVIVDLLTGATDRISVPGLNEDVTWFVDGKHLLVSSGTGTWLVNVESRSYVPAAANGGDVAALVGGAAGLMTLTLPGSDDQAPILRVYDDGGLVEKSQHAIDGGAGPYRFGSLTPRGWRYGNLIAQGGSGQGATTHGDFVAIVDDRTNTVTDLLDLGTGRAKGCCAVLGWQNADAVVIRTDREGLIAWQLSTGRVTQLSPPAYGTISVAPTGCDYSVTIAGISSMCVV